MTEEQKIKNKINDYIQTIHAIVGFMNLYRFDDQTRSIDDKVIVFQGRKLYKKADSSIYYTSDLGILLENNDGILGEVKKSFPKDQEHWMDDFKQLMSYDQELSDWPSKSGGVTNQDIVLIVHQTRAGSIRKYYNERIGAEINFTRPFVLVQFNQSLESEHFYFFQKLIGELTHEGINQRLDIGISIPMSVLLKLYSTIKVYDSKPPLPYTLFLIWEHVVVDKAQRDPKFLKLKRNQKIEITISIHEILNTLQNGFSFQLLSPDKQPKMPLREWIIEACEFLIKFDMASWIDASKANLKIIFKKYEDVLQHFIELHLQSPENLEPTLFDEKIIL